MAVKKREKSSPLDTLTTIEILAYRAVLLVSFLIYAYKHIRAEWLGP